MSLPETEDPLMVRIEAMLAQAASPAEQRWQEALTELHVRCRTQQRLLDRLVRISDHFQMAERERGMDYAAKYERKVRQLEKIVRISDRYQLMLTELNTRLEFTSTHDVLTGLVNRRSMAEQLEHEVERARRTGASLVVAIGDIDRFKMINDAYGHAVGDRVLVRIAQVFRDNLREYDGCARWGGEEFLLLFPETGAAEARKVIERLRVEIGRPPVSGELPSATISIGFTQYQPPESIDQALQRADTALYQAKADGRDCIREA